MDKDNVPSSSPNGRIRRAIRAFLEREPEVVTRDGVLLIAIFYVIAFIYFFIRMTKDALCG